MNNPNFIDFQNRIYHRYFSPQHSRPVPPIKLFIECEPVISLHIELCFYGYDSFEFSEALLEDVKKNNFDLFIDTKEINKCNNGDKYISTRKYFNDNGVLQLQTFIKHNVVNKIMFTAVYDSADIAEIKLQGNDIIAIDEIIKHYFDMKNEKVGTQ